MVAATGLRNEAGPCISRATDPASGLVDDLVVAIGRDEGRCIRLVPYDFVRVGRGDPPRARSRGYKGLQTRVTAVDAAASAPAT